MPYPFMRKADTVAIDINAATIGYLSILPESYARKLKLKSKITWFEINLDLLLNVDQMNLEYQKKGDYPGSYLDFTFQHPKNAGYETLLDCLTEFQHPYLKQISFTDFYEDQVSRDVSYYTFRMLLKSADKTLQHPEIIEVQNQFLQYINQHGLSLKE